MKSSALKRFFGVVISIILIMSSIALITILALKSTFQKDNVLEMLKDFNLQEYLVSCNKENYDNLVKRANDYSVQQNELDDMLKSDAAKNLTASCISDVVLQTLDGTNPLIALTDSLKNNISKNIDGMVDSIDVTSNLTDEQKASLTTEQKQLLETEKQARFKENKDVFKDNMCKIVDEMRSEAMNRSNLGEFVDISFSFFNNFHIIAIILIIICIALLVVLFKPVSSFGLWLAIDSFIITIITILTYISTGFCSTATYSFILNRLPSSANNVFTQMFGSILDSFLNEFSSHYLIPSIICVVVSVICVIVALKTTPEKD